MSRLGAAASTTHSQASLLFIPFPGSLLAESEIHEAFFRVFLLPLMFFLPHLGRGNRLCSQHLGLLSRAHVSPHTVSQSLRNCSIFLSLSVCDCVLEATIWSEEQTSQLNQANGPSSPIFLFLTWQDLDATALCSHEVPRSWYSGASFAQKNPPAQLCMNEAWSARLAQIESAGWTHPPSPPMPCVLVPSCVCAFSCSVVS